MRNSPLMLFVTILTSIAAFGQEDYRPAVSSTVPNTSKFEIIQTTSRTPSMTMRLDKSTGRVFRAASCPQKTFIGTGLCWKEMTVLELPKNTSDGVPRYQIFIGTNFAGYIFLMNVVSGQTWLYETEDRWTPLLDTIILQQSFDIVR